ncbi:hypothetical protein RB653_002811 [Dictyostelium firmibasis]|uniref:Phosphatidylinositol-glycan-specific phospholipase D n=1 Tax=Dictyostelium firmibasis TaxID=79012 RepID=A0AAN7UAC3_9MYCE
MKNKIYILFVSILFLYTISNVKGCGMTTHNTVARRAFNFSSFDGFEQYQKYISENFDVFDAGAAFPDFGYDCGGLANESEAAHWPPFLRAATKYLLETYTQPWSLDGIRLAVFLLGVTSHQIADISWHSIGGIQQGLIRAMAGQDFNGTYEIAHSNADEGGEFELAYNYDLSWLSDKWYVPITDIKNIFHSMNYTRVDDENLLRCNAILYAGAMGVKMGGRFFYPEIAKKSPFLVDHYQDYFIGGLDDMSIWTSYCWPVLMGWMDGEAIGDFCFIQPDPNNQLLSDEKNLHHKHSILRNGSKIKEALSKSILNEMKITNHGKGVTFSLPNKMEKAINQALNKFNQNPIGTLLEKYFPDLSDKLFNLKQKQQLNGKEEQEEYYDDDYDENQEEEEEELNIKPIRMLSKNSNFKNYEYLNDNNIKPKKSLKKNKSKKNIMRFNSDSNDLGANFTTIYGQNMYSYFGKDIRTKDLNGDGFDDLIISSPGFGVPGSMQTGCVYYIISNGSTDGTNKPGNTDFSSEVDIDQVATGKLCGNETHAKFGWNIDVLDFNLDGIIDIIIGAPSSSNANLQYLGMVYIYLGVKNSDGIWTTESDLPSITIQGLDYPDTIGTVLRVADCNADSNPDLILGSPHSGGGGIQRGTIQIFYSSKKRITGTSISLNDADYYEHGDVDYEWFGYEIKVSGQGDSSTLLVGSPNYHDEETAIVNIGKITAFPYNVNLNAFDLNPKFVMVGVNKNDKLGYSYNMVNGSLFGLDNVNDILVLSLPTRGFGDDFDQVGEVVLIDIDSLSGFIEINSVFPLLSIKGTTKYSRFGESLLIGKLESSDQFARLFVGAPLWTDSIDTGPGCVFSFLPNQHLTNDPSVLKQNIINNTPVVIYDSTHSVKTYKLDDTGSGGRSFNNKRKDSRFGFRTLLSDFNNDGRNDLIVSADRDSSKLLEGGSINIFQ